MLKLKLQDKNDFELSTLPALVPVMSTAVGETLLLLVKHAELIIGKVRLSNLFLMRIEIKLSINILVNSFLCYDFYFGFGGWWGFGLPFF